MNYKPLAGQVLIKVQKAKEDDSGLLLPTEVEDNIGIIIKSGDGPLQWGTNDYYGALCHFQPGYGIKVQHMGEEHILIARQHILALIDVEEEDED